MMKKLILAGIGAFAVLACSAAEDSGSAVDETVAASEQPLTNIWIGPVSEEAWKQSAQCGGSPNAGASAARCAGSYCDDMYLFCSALPQGFTTNGLDFGWTSYVSEENGSPVVACPGGSVIDGIRAAGSYADNISVHCTGVNFPNQWLTWWQPWFSEEQGQQTFTGVPNQPNQVPSVAVAVRCSGSYCDNLSFLVASRACSSNAECAPTNRICDGGLCKFPI